MQISEDELVGEARNDTMLPSISSFLKGDREERRGTERVRDSGHREKDRERDGEADLTEINEEENREIGEKERERNGQCVRCLTELIRLIRVRSDLCFTKLRFIESARER